VTVGAERQLSAPPAAVFRPEIERRHHPLLKEDHVYLLKSEIIVRLKNARVGASFTSLVMMYHGTARPARPNAPASCSANT
jgi:hypothetical protein